MAPTQPKGEASGVVSELENDSKIQPVGWQPQTLASLPTNTSTLNELQKLTPRQAELGGITKSPSKLSSVQNSPKPQETATTTSIAPTDGPLQGNCENIELLHSGSKWFWRPNIHIDVEVYYLPLPIACYAARIKHRDESREMPYLFFDKEKIDAEIDSEYVAKGPPLAPHEALKRAREGPRRTIDIASLSEEEQKLKKEADNREQQKRSKEQASTICLNKIELLKNKESGIIKVFIKKSSLTGETSELSRSESNTNVIESIRLPRTPFTRPENASVAEFRRINKLFEKHMDKAKEARASAEDIHQAQADVVEMLKTNIRHTIPSARTNATEFGKKVFGGLTKLKIINTRELLAAKGIK